MKKTNIILITILVVLLLLVAYFTVLLGKRAPTSEPIPPVQVYSPQPIQSLSPQIPREMEAEKINQENYAKSREGFIVSKPWVLKLPLKSNNYFVSYNPDSDTLITELYYLENSTLGKSQQLSEAKQTAINAMISIGIDINKQKIEYIELLKKQ